MSKVAIEGLAREIDEVRKLGRTLTDEEWARPSACWGWSVQDVYSHMGCLWHGLVDPVASPLPEFVDVENENEVPVRERRAWKPQEVLAEYEEYADGALAALDSFQAPEVANAPFDAKTLGVYPTHILADALTFDHYAHLREDILGPIGTIDRPMPPTDAARLEATMNWMTTGLPNMCRTSLYDALGDGSVRIDFSGLGGGSWLLHRGSEGGTVAMDRVDGGEAADAVATSTTEMYVSWGTKRRDWRRCGVRLSGDTALATRVLDAVNFV